MAQRKPPESTTHFATVYGPPPQAASRPRETRVFQIPPEHLEGVREGLDQVRRGEICDEAEVEALLAPDSS